MSPRPGFGANLLRRVATAAVALPLLLALVFLGPPVAFVTLAAAVLMLGMRELLGLLAAAGVRPSRLTAWAALAAFFVDAATASAGSVPLWPLGLAVASLGALGRDDHRAALTGAAAAWLGAAYLGGLGGAIAALRLLPPAEDGAWRVVMLLAAVMAADTAAFFVGHALGRRPLSAISPGKTVEGALGGLAGGALGALAVRSLGLPSVPALHAAGLGVAVAVLGVGGDLIESRLKRAAGAKDSGGVFPGHGGVLDRVDSLLLASPVLYYYFWLSPSAR